MQETDFIDQNKEKWEEFETILEQSDKDPDRITSLFIETTDDLSYSQTYYPNRSVRVYLNGIAQQLYQTVYTNKRRERNAFFHFWTHDLPDVMWHARKQLLVAFVVFMAAVFIGTISSMYYPEFVKIMLGDAYVAMTESNIEKGDPMAVYKSGDAINSFFEIAINNIMISFRVFVLGITFGVLTYFFLMYNGIMVGAFVYFFVERGLMKESLLAIMLHGTLELSMIVLSGCAGLYLAKGLVFPGTYRRIDAMLITSRGAIKIMVAVFVFLLYAAFVESFGTRFTSFDEAENGKAIVDATRAIFIIISLALVVGYFVLLPYLRFKRGAVKPLESEDLPPTKAYVFSTKQIKSPAILFTESFRVFGENALRIVQLSVVISFLTVVVFYMMSQGNIASVFESEMKRISREPWLAIWSWNSYDNVISFSKFPLLPLFMLVMFYFWVRLTFRSFTKTLSLPETRMKWYVPFYVVLPVVLAFYVPPGMRFFALVGAFVFGGMAFFNSAMVKHQNPKSKTSNLIFPRMFQLMAVFGMILLLQTFALFTTNAQLLDLVLQVISMNVPSTWINAADLNGVLYLFVLAFVPIVLISISFFALGLHAFHSNEVETASALHERIAVIGKKKRAYGLEQE